MRVARVARVRMVCRVLWLRALDGRLGASMLLMVGGRPKTAGLTVLRLMLVDRGILRRRDMRVRDWITFRYRFVARGVVDRHCISCVPGWSVVGNAG